jgi:hypothetical protein
MRIRHSFGLAALALLATSACAGTAGGPVATPPAQAAADQLRAACGAVEFDGLPADWSTLPALGAVEGDLDLAGLAAERWFFDAHDWFVAAHSRGTLTLFGVPRESPAADDGSRPGYAYASLTSGGQGWVPRGWGQCRIEVTAPGWGNARFVLDPEAEPDPDSSTVSLLAWETACANGQAPDGRDVEPVIVAAAEGSVSIVVLVEPVRGDAVCPSNPGFPLQVELGEPLGRRVIIDASVDPPYERPWPPTRSSLDSQGLDE